MPVRFRVDPRDVPPEKAARRLHLTLAEFEAVLPRLKARRFPAPDPDTGNYDLKAIDAWMDERSGSATEAAERYDTAADFKARLEALRGKGRRRLSDGLLAQAATREKLKR